MFNDGYDWLCLSLITNNSGRDAIQATTDAYCGCQDYLARQDAQVGHEEIEKRTVGFKQPHQT